MVMVSRPSIYIGHALTGAPEEFVNHADAIRQRLRERYQVLDFLGLVAGTARDVYESDANCVRTCGAFIALPEVPSTGLGMELQIAISISKPTLVLHRTGVRITRMLLGSPNPNQEVADYGTVDEAVGHVGAFVDRMFRT